MDAAPSEARHVHEPDERKGAVTPTSARAGAKPPVPSRTRVITDETTNEAVAVQFASSDDARHTKRLMFFDVECRLCMAPGKEIMVRTDIPYFQVRQHARCRWTCVGVTLT